MKKVISVFIKTVPSPYFEALGENATFPNEKKV